MDAIQLLVSILDKPAVPKYYRRLRDWYRSKGMIQEAEAVSHLIEQKFGKNYDQPDDSSGCEKSRTNDRSDI